MLRRFFFDRRGATAVEYSILVLFISIVIIAGVRVVGTTLYTKAYAPISTNLS